VSPPHAPTPTTFLARDIGNADFRCHLPISYAFCNISLLRFLFWHLWSYRGWDLRAPPPHCSSHFVSPDISDVGPGQGMPSLPFAGTTDVPPYHYHRLLHFHLHFAGSLHVALARLRLHTVRYTTLHLPTPLTCTLLSRRSSTISYHLPATRRLPPNHPARLSH